MTKRDLKKSKNVYLLLLEGINNLKTGSMQIMQS